MCWFNSLGECILERFHNILQSSVEEIPQEVLEEYVLQHKKRLQYMVRCPDIWGSGRDEDMVRELQDYLILVLDELLPYMRRAVRSGQLLWCAQEKLDPGTLTEEEEVEFARYKKIYF